MKTEIGTAWVARDEDGRVFYYEGEPTARRGGWDCWGNIAIVRNVDWLPGVPWDESCRKVKLFAEVIADES